MATTWAIMHLSERGLLQLDDTVARFIPAFGCDEWKKAVTIRHILTHTSGLPGPLPLYREYQQRERLLEAIYRQPLVFAPGSGLQYCDVGFLLLGEVVRVVSEIDLNEYTHRYLYEPLGMHDTLFNPSGPLLERVAPTEYAQWRGGLVHGVVHDENAWMVGAIAGHAGLFSTIEDVGRFCEMLLNGGEYEGRRVLSEESVAMMTSLQRADPYESFGLGWMLNRPSFMGRFASNETYGHTGFTGTSIVVVPKQRLAVALLSNRVCPTRHGPDIAPYRRQIADALELFLEDC
jgi:CubicO group peptidase (beta-lactamase class C family)